MSTATISATSLLVGALSLMSSSAVLADVTLEERLAVSGNGLMSMGNMSGTSTTVVAGDRARTQSSLTFQSGLMRTLARSAGESVEIVRLDQDKVYTLDLKKKTYTETTFAEQRAQMQKVMEQTREAQATQQQQSSGVNEAQCEWSDPKADVQRTGEKGSFAGFDAERVTVTATQSCKDAQSGQVCDFGLTLDQWLAPGFDAEEETLAYQRAYAEKLGLGALASRDFSERAETMFGRYDALWKELATKMRDVKGYPVKASFGLAVGGPQCNSAQQQAAATPAPSVSGALSDAFGGLIGRKKKSEPAAPPPAAPGGLIPLMTVSTELVSVSKAPASASSFEVPPEYKKAK
jgi:hypothetical protein